MDTNTTYTLDKNGDAKRKNQTVIKSSCAMLDDQALPKFLLAEVFNACVYVQNRIPYEALDLKILEEFFTDKKPNVSHLEGLIVLCIFMCLKRK